MIKFKYPGYRTLFCAWVILIVLTIGTVFTGRVGEMDTIGLPWLAALLFVTGFKAFAILHWFLNLRAASSGWNKLFICYLVLLFLIIFGSYVIK